MKITDDKAVELAVPILCALINNGHLPGTVAHSVDISGAMVQDYLLEIAKQIKTVHSLLESENA